MGITTFVTLITKDGCFDEFYNLAKEELAFTRQSKGCKSILVSTNRETNTMKMVQFWEDETSYDDPHQAVKTFLAVSLITGVFPPGFDAA